MDMIIAIVGMAGSGKSEVAKFFKDLKIPVLRFGDITEEEIKRKGLELTPQNEKRIREALRKKHGMDVYAKIIHPKIEKAKELSSLVVLDGLYSWEEYLHLRSAYDQELVIVAVLASPKARYARLEKRPVRPLTFDEARKRDHAEIENINKGGPIAMADHHLVNEGTRDDLMRDLERLFDRLKE